MPKESFPSSKTSFPLRRKRRASALFQSASAVAVGVGLLAAPMEQAQTSRYPAIINFVDLVGAFDSNLIQILFCLTLALIFLISALGQMLVTLTVTSTSDTPGIFQGAT